MPRKGLIARTDPPEAEIRPNSKIISVFSGSSSEAGERLSGLIFSSHRALRELKVMNNYRKKT
jgi:hypothetical protein